MTRIQAITMQNLKGTTDRQPLTGKDIFIGSNGSGKTTRLQALQMSMLGYVPGYGKRAVDNYKFSSDDSVMSTGLELEEFKFSRTFTRTTKLSKGIPTVSISESITVSPARGERTETDKKTRVAAEVGNFPVMLDFNEFLTLSDAKRRDFIYGLSAGIEGGWDKERVSKYLEDRLLTMELEIKSPDLYQALSEIIATSLNEYHDNMPIDEGLLAMRGYISREWSTWKEKARNAEGAIKQLAEQKNRMAETDRNIEANKQELTDLRERLIKVESQLAKDTERKKAIDRRLSRIKELDSIIAQLSAKTPESTEWIDQQIESLESQMVHIDDSDGYKERAEEKLSNQQELSQIQEQMAQINQDTTRLTAEKASLQQTLNTIHNAKGVCVIQKKIACNKDFSSYIEHATKEIANKNVQIDVNNEQFTTLKDSVQSIQMRMAEIDYEMSSIMDRMQKQQKENAQNAKSIKNLQAQKSVILNTEQKRLDDLKRAQEEREKLQNEPVEAIAPLDLLESQRNGLRGQITELESKVEEQEKVRNQMSVLRNSMLVNKESGYKSEAFKMLDQAMGSKGIQGEIVKTMLEPMQKDIEANLQVLGIDFPVFFQTESDTGQEIFQFGWEDRGIRRNFDALSTGQQMIFLIGFLVAVLDRAKPPIKVLALDNIENLDENNLKNVLHGLDKLADKLDNILIAGVVDVHDIIPTGWTVHLIGQEVETNDVA
ncbi:hypothetical protein [Brevibacillus laterosporus]|uniref:Nuclease SbcCD subunit C n=1 Tax=Brevibacillus laterosporus TaxID=1465 RepID=A0AAP3DKM9_BRELA|nr:hypothetical protein [Brevibacillus laterosporus]MCR8981610.1 hypothetical protein [Brevibacillus laterosporus]MCZ0808765.1 hypothetical protein [Brevibacillus laterosporus]MCZ0827262.1 hypothetical protein [Brevibacillus laterosporus]MCZ0851018.1 hypothetical protein [Brevibacillus laterosporus]